MARLTLIAASLCALASLSLASTVSRTSYYGWGWGGRSWQQLACESRPKLMVFVTPTVNEDLEGEIGRVSGTATFEPYWDPSNYGRCMTKITGKIVGLGDDTKHGWHIHEFGDISNNTGSATGGHYDPNGDPHGLPPNFPRHVGDLGNLTPGKDGVAHIEQYIVLDTADVRGRGLIVHAAIDDGGQPTGNSGARLGQGVLGVIG